MLKKEKEVDTLYTIDLYALCIDDYFMKEFYPPCYRINYSSRFLNWGCGMALSWTTIFRGIIFGSRGMHEEWGESVNKEWWIEACLIHENWNFYRRFLA